MPRQCLVVPAGRKMDDMLDASTRRVNALNRQQKGPMGRNGFHITALDRGPAVSRTFISTRAITSSSATSFVTVHLIARTRSFSGEER